MTSDWVRDVVAADSVVTESFGCITVDVEPAEWVAVATALRDGSGSGCDFFDWLSAYDDGDAGLAVVARLWSVEHRHGVILRTRVPRIEGSLPTLTEVWAGASWHERETHEMFGIDFEGHPGLHPLLLPDGFEGNPLRKEFVLASRIAKDWPGAKEPGESVPGRKRPLGVPGTGSRRPS